MTGSEKIKNLEAEVKSLKMKLGMVSRKEVMSLLRDTMKIKQVTSYSEPRKEFQRIKLWVCHNSTTKMSEILGIFGYKNIDVYPICNDDGIESVILEFPYNDYC